MIGTYSFVLRFNGRVRNPIRQDRSEAGIDIRRMFLEEPRGRNAKVPRRTARKPLDGPNGSGLNRARAAAQTVDKCDEVGVSDVIWNVFKKYGEAATIRGSKLFQDVGEPSRRISERMRSVRVFRHCAQPVVVGHPTRIL